MADYVGTKTGTAIDTAVDAVEYAKTASSTETTAGRLLKLGDFGIGSLTNISTEADFNDVKRTSFNGSLNKANAPSVGIGVRSTIPYSNDWVLQQFSEIKEKPTSFIRGFYNGTTWSDWYEVATEANDALIESGSNANGSYTKFPDGRLICTYNSPASTSIPITLSSGGQFYYDAAYSFPASFVGLPSVANTSKSTGAVTVTQTAVVTTTGANLRFQSVASNTVNHNVSYVAIGVWK